MSTKVEAEYNNDNNDLHLRWDMTGRFQGPQELRGSLGVLVGQGDHLCLDFQEDPAKTQTEQIQVLSLQGHWGTNLSIHNKIGVTVVGKLSQTRPQPNSLGR